MRTLCTLLFLAALAQAEFNRAMYVSPLQGETRSKGEIVVFHEGQGQPGEGYFKRHEPGEVAEFYLFVPKGLAKNKRYPLIIGYHGGKDGGKGKGVAGSLSRLSTKQHPLFVLAPNMYTLDSYKEILALQKYPIDTSRVVVFGHSSGGMGVVAAMKEYVTSKGAFTPALLISASTTASIGRNPYPPVPYVVMAGEKETPEFVKHPLLKTRRATCRRHALVMQQVFTDVRYIEIEGVGHASGKPNNLAVLANLIRALPEPKVKVPKVRPDPAFEKLLEAVRRNDFETARAEIKRLDADPKKKTNYAYAALRRKLLDNLAQWVKAEVKTIAGLTPRSTTLQVTRALNTYDLLEKAVKLFADTKKGPALQKSFDLLASAKAKHWQRELEARKRYRELVAQKPSEELKTQLEKLRQNYSDTEYGARRTIEKLLALEG